jgi:hypothetical protein
LAGEKGQSFAEGETKKENHIKYSLSNDGTANLLLYNNILKYNILYCSIKNTIPPLAGEKGAIVRRRRNGKRKLQQILSSIGRNCTKKHQEVAICVQK